jgi:hypothetical protein
MAKKAKAAKKATAKKKAGAKVPLHKVVHFVRMLHDRKRAAKFIAHAKKNGAKITIPPASVAVINDFLEKHDLQGNDVCPTPDPWKCS